MRFKKLLPALLPVLVAAVSCRQEVVVSPQPIAALYDSVARFPGMDSLQRAAFMRADSSALSAMLGYLGSDSLTETELLAWSESLPVTVFTPAVDSVFPTLDGVEMQLGRILVRAAADSLDIPRRSYAAVVWGNRKSIVMVDSPSDSVMLIALNHYLGADYPGYAHWPVYMRLDKTPARLPYDLAEALVADRWPYWPDADATALSRIVYEGALTLAKIRLVPDGDMSGALGYTQAQLEWLADNEHAIWLKMIDSRLLYDTSAITAERLVSPSPATSAISPDTPGRVGRYIGYRIICAYMRQNADVALREMLSPEFYNNPAVLVQAAYEGR